MHEGVTFVVAITPAIAFGWMLPSLFTLFDTDIKAPLDKRTVTLALLALPWMFATGEWVSWWIDSNRELVHNISNSWLSAVCLSVLGTMLRLNVLPWARIRLHEFAEWLRQVTA